MTLEPEQITRRAALVIVAHPDDEIIWCGGLILRRPDWDWSIFSLCRSTDPDRRPKFLRVCRHLRAQGMIADLDDSCPPARVDVGRDIGGRIRRQACDRAWDLCIAHGANGEYGHARHRQIHREVLRLVAGGELRCEQLWTFAYDCDPNTGHCLVQPHADIRIDLTDDQLAEKKRIVRDVYGYEHDSFEVRACISPEGFGRNSIAKGAAQ